MQTIHAPLSSAAAYWLNRAVAKISPPSVRDMHLSLIWITISPSLGRGATGAKDGSLRVQTHPDSPRPTHTFSLVRGSPLDSVRPSRTSSIYMACRRSSRRSYTPLSYAPHLRQCCELLNFATYSPDDPARQSGVITNLCLHRLKTRLSPQITPIRSVRTSRMGGCLPGKRGLTAEMPRGMAPHGG